MNCSVLILLGFLGFLGFPGFSACFCCFCLVSRVFLGFLLVSVVSAWFPGFSGVSMMSTGTQKNVGKDNMNTIDRGAPTNKEVFFVGPKCCLKNSILGANPFYGRSQMTLENSRLLLKMGDEKRAKHQKKPKTCKNSDCYDLARSLRLNQHASTVSNSCFALCFPIVGTIWPFFQTKNN